MKRLLFGLFLGVCLFAGCNNGPSGPPAIGVSVAATTSASVKAGGTVTLTATVTNDAANKGVTWSVSCSAGSCGSVAPGSSASGASVTYTAPAAPPNTNLTVTVTATSVADATKSGSTSVTVLAITVTVAPPTATVDANSSTTFTATVANDPASGGVNWTLTQGGVACSPTCGTVSPATTASGAMTTYTAPTTPPASSLTVTITATSATNSANSGSATITVPAITVSVAPPSATVQAGSTQQFMATVSNFPTNTAVTWTLTQGGLACSPTCGTLSSTTTNPTTYTAPSTTPSSNLSVTITATSVADVTKAGSAAITVPAITVTVAPPTATVEAKGTQQFTATVNNTSNTAVTWSISLTQGGASCSPTCGTLSSTSTNPTTYTAPATAPASDLTVFITATSSADATKSGSATITVPAITVSVNPATATVAVNATKNFTATVSNDPNNAGASWSLTGTGCSGATCGTLTNVTTTSVTYTAPASVPSPPTVTLTATSVTDGTKSASATITLTSGVNNAELNGHYAILFNGFNDTNGAMVEMVASIVADGAGNISSGEVGVCQGGGLPSCLVSGTGSITGTYTIGTDNRGTMNLTYTSGITTLSHTYAIAVGLITTGVAHKVRFIEFDDTTGLTGSRGTGVMFLQNTSAFTQGSISGKYAFGFAGHNPTAGRFAMAGVVNANGSGGVTGGTADQNDAGTITNSISITGTSYTTPDAAGIGSFTLAVSGGATTTPVNWEYAVVDAGHLLVVTTGSGATVATISGQAFIQTIASFSNSSLSGNSVVYFSKLGSTPGDSKVSIGVVQADGNGNFTITLDENDSGTITANSTGTGTYMAASNGRATISGTGSHNPILYLVGTNEFFLIGTNTGVDSGFAEAQSAGPFSNSTINGNYIFGVRPPVVTGSSVESGVVTSPGNGNFTVTSDESDANGTLTSGGVLMGTISTLNSTNGRVTDSLGDAAYIIGPNKFVLISESMGSTAPTITIVEK